MASASEGGHARYEIRVRGHLEDRWAAWFEGFTVARQADGTTLLTGPVVDEAALHGWLKRVRDLGLPLISVGPAASDPVITPAVPGAERIEEEVDP